MRFRTEIEPLKYAGLLSHDSRIVMIGSCFTDEVGARLQRDGFEVDVNPFGTLYNPESIADEIEKTLRGEQFSREDLFKEGEAWHTFRRHSRFSSPDADTMLCNLNADSKRVAAELAAADCVILTFGSAIAFRHVASNQIVANCHKVDSREFVRETIPLERIVERFKHVVEELRKVNPGVKLIFTVSPVRHLGYGLVADRISKSTLLLACNRLTTEIPDAIYFPSYEIMIDDLRDYRFYKNDLVHPSDMGVDYVYSLFSESFMTPATIAQARVYEKESRRQAHRQIFPNEPK